MDIILSAYATENLETMDEATIQLYDVLLDENDQDLYQWVTGQVPAPEKFRQMIARISVQMQGNAA
jgi:antitoxin CptB